MSNKKWEIGDLVKFEGRDGVVYGIVINFVRYAKHGRKYYEVQWFDGEETSRESPNEAHNKIVKVSG